MDAAAQAIARRAAGRLRTAYGASLPTTVERALLSPGATPVRYSGGAIYGASAGLVGLTALIWCIVPFGIFLRERADRAIAIAALVISLAQLAWQIRQDLAPRACTPEVLARDLRIKVELPSGLTDEDGERVISVIVEEATQFNSMSSVP